MARDERTTLQLALQEFLISDTATTDERGAAESLLQVLLDDAASVGQEASDGIAAE